MSDGDLASITTKGMPLTNRTKSGMTMRASSSGPPRSLPRRTRNWVVTTNSLRPPSGCSKSKKRDDAGISSPQSVHSQGHPVGEVLVDRLVAGHAGGVDVF